MLLRAYSLFTIKSVDDDERVIEGIASTPKTDRMGDIVEPKGAQFTLPIPLLWQHKSGEPIGHVTKATITDDGILVRAELVKFDEPGELKNLLDKAWHMIKTRLVRGLSIGFQPIEMADIAGSWGQRFLTWDWLELSAVTIPANMDATIQTVKSCDTFAPGGDRRGKSVRVLKPAASPGAPGSVKLISPSSGARTVLNATEQIRSFEATRQAKAARMNEIQEAAAKAGRSKEPAEQEEFDTLRDEIKSIDRELGDLKDMETLNASQAKPVNGSTSEKAAESRNPSLVVVRGAPPAAPGIRFARVVRCIAVSAKRYRDIGSVAKELYPEDALVQKAAVAAGSTSDASWAGALVGEEGAVFADFVEFLRPQTILGKFGTNGVPSLRRVPFRVPLIGQTSGGNGYWVGEGKAKPLTKFDFERSTLEPLKVANIAAVTEEVLRDSSPSAETLIRDSLAGALRSRMDTDFIDPNKAAVAGVSPASITNGVAVIASSGTDAAAVRADIKALFAAFIADNNAPTTGVWIMPSTMALSLSLMVNPLGQPEFPGITMNGGTLFGLPVIVSEYVPTAYDPDGAGAGAAGAIVVLANASDIYLADDGGVSVDMSREASLEMDDAPTSSSAPAAESTLVSMFQTNSVAFRAERTVNWKKRRAGAVKVIGSVAWA